MLLNLDHNLGMKLLLLAASISCYIQFQALGQLVVLSDCVCPGHELRLECTVVRGATTVWGGSAFSGCSNNEIVLRHSQFEHGLAVGECNNGVIVGRSIRQVGDNYTSQLIVHLDLHPTLRGKTVECFHDDGLHEVTVGNYTIIYPSLRDPDPPHDVHLASIDTKKITFSWSPVLSNCSIGYRITSMDCIACPSFTLDTTVNCTITTNRTNRQDQMCTFYVQSVICGNYTGNQHSSVTVKLKVPDIPKIIGILPYYSNKLKNLTRIHVQVTTPNTDFFNNSEELDFPTTSHTATLCYDPDHTTDGTDSCIVHTILTSSCSEGVCQFEFNDLSQLPTLSHEESSAVVAVRAYSSNIVGDGLESGPILVDKTNTLFQVTFESTNRSLSCHFIGYHGNTTCRIVYGLRESTNQQSPSIKYQVENTSTAHLVMVTLPQASLQTTSETTFQFVAFGTTENYTIAVEDTFEIATDSENTIITRGLIIIISVCCITTISVEVIIFIIVCYKLLGKRKISRQQDTEENEYIHEFSASQPIQSQQPSNRPVVYADVNLVSTRSASTRKANPAAVSDDRVEYAALNHELTFEIRNSTSDEVNAQEIYDDTTNDYSLNLDNLLIKTRTQVTPCWYQFGLALGISEQILNSYASYPPEECVVEMLDHWLRNSKVEPTWKDVVEALSKMEPYQQAKVDVATIAPYSPQMDAVCDELDSGSFPPPPLPPPPLPPKGLKAL